MTPSSHYRLKNDLHEDQRGTDCRHRNSHFLSKHTGVDGGGGRRRLTVVAQIRVPFSPSFFCRSPPSHPNFPIHRRWQLLWNPRWWECGGSMDLVTRFVVFLHVSVFSCDLQHPVTGEGFRR
ncbi:hypothetical protein L1987_89954 [Smallanthus sonchifolius]|nr:hypothetical protein L1987_89954 [Smallanthus sonchifolius]